VIDTYRRSNVTLTVDDHGGAGQVTFTITRTAPLTDDEVRNVNAELADYNASHGAQLVQSPDTGEWEVRTGTVLASDHGDSGAVLQWVAHL
jgi:hypothetical protein